MARLSRAEIFDPTEIAAVHVMARTNRRCFLLGHAYESTPIAAFDLCPIGTVSDFKEISRYRLLGTGGFEKVSLMVN